MPVSRTLRFSSALGVALAALAGCSAAIGNVAGSVRHEANVAIWPLRFKSHYFGAHCFDTQRCEVLYRGFSHGDDQPSPSVASYGRPLEDLLTAGRGPIPNFPPPAEVTWQAKDGTALHAVVDIGEIFRDGVIRHNLKRDETSENTLRSDLSPQIIVVVDDRTITVYMRAHISTRELQRPGNRFSDFRADLAKAFARTY